MADVPTPPSAKQTLQAIAMLSAIAVVIGCFVTAFVTESGWTTNLTLTNFTAIATIVIVSMTMKTGEKEDNK